MSSSRVERVAHTAKPGLVSRLMDACRGPKALWALGVLSFLESSFLPVPIDIAMVPICLARPKELWKIILVGAIGSFLGALVGYMIGVFLMETIGAFLVSVYGGSEALMKIEALYHESGWKVIAIAGLTPLPFKVATLAAGAASMPFAAFALSVFLVRLARFAMIAAVVAIFGASFQKMLNTQGRSFAIIMTVLAIVSIVAVPLFL